MTQAAIIVTGAAQGIGKAITHRCLNEGYRVLACDKNAEGLLRLQDDLKHPALETYALDVSDYAAVVDFFSHISAYPLYGLVNNAGIYLGQSFLDYSPEAMAPVLDINIKGALYFSQQFGRHVLRTSNPGALVNIASVAAHMGSSDVLYGTSKGALLGLTKSCALTFAPQIRVNAVAPGIVETDLIRNIPQSRLAHYRQSELLPDPITPEDIAHSVWFLLSPESAHYTGAVLDLNNGFYIR